MNYVYKNKIYIQNIYKNKNNVYLYKKCRDAFGIRK